MEHTPIACAIVDNLEVACLYHYHIQLHLSDEQKLDGEAMDLTRNSDGEECLRFQVETEMRDVPLANIVTVEAITENPFFSTLKLRNAKVCR